MVPGGACLNLKGSSLLYIAMKQSVSLDRFGRWSSGIAAAATATTPEALSARFTAAAQALLASDRVYVGLYHRDSSSTTIDDCGPDRWNRDYDARAYRQDPFFRYFARTKQDFLLPLSAVSRGDFKRTPYYLEFYGPSGCFDEITGVFNLDRRTAGYVTFVRHTGGAPYGEPDLMLADAAGQATRFILERLLRLCKPNHRDATANAPLSVRERQITHLLLSGDCAKSISRTLQISPGTVRNHIKQIYRKLGVHSQVELLALTRSTRSG